MDEEEGHSDALTSTLASFNYEYDEPTSIDDPAITAASSSPSAQVKLILAAANSNNSLNDTIDSPSAEYRALMEIRHNESSQLRTAIVSVGLTIVSLGLLANLLFALLISCPSKRRPNRTPTQLIMLSICVGYFVFLLAYALKLSVYLNGHSLMKFSVYDSVENWIYGAFMCKLTSAAPIFIKLLSRFSLLFIVLRRLALKLSAEFSSSKNYSLDFLSNSSPNYSLNIEQQQNDSAEHKLNIEEDADMNLSMKLNRKKNKYSLNNNSSPSSSSSSSSSSASSKRESSFIEKLFGWPSINFFILFVWAGSFASSLPIYLTYKLDAESRICDSVYLFPDEIHKFASLHLNYLMYGLVLPLGLIFIFLLTLFALNLKCFSESKKLEQKIVHTSSNASFDDAEYNSIHWRAKNNNSLLWLSLCVMLFTSLPPEVYRYLQLNINLKDDEILESYLESIFVQPVLSARPYYGMQLLYMSEFALLPLIFILYYICSTSLSNKIDSHRNSSSAAAAAAAAARPPNVKMLSKSSSIKNLGLLLFYDNELCKRRASKRYVERNYSTNNDKNSQDALLNSNNEGTITKNPFYKSKADALAKQHQQAAAKDSIHNSNDDGKLVHIIQHPSWRINIKQPQNGPTQLPILNKTSLNSNSNAKTAHRGPVSLPFSYKKTTNMYNS